MSAKDPKAANRPTCGLLKAKCATAKTAGITTAARTDRLTTSRSGSLLRIQRGTARGLPVNADIDGAAEVLIRLVLIIPKAHGRGKRSGPASLAAAGAATAGDSVGRDVR